MFADGLFDACQQVLDAVCRLCTSMPEIERRLQKHDATVDAFDVCSHWVLLGWATQFACVRPGTSNAANRGGAGTVGGVR